MLAKYDSIFPVENKKIKSSLIASMLNSADDHQTKYEIYEIYEIWINFICQNWNKSNMKYEEN